MWSFIQINLRHKSHSEVQTDGCCTLVDVVRAFATGDRQDQCRVHQSQEGYLEWASQIAITLSLINAMNCGGHLFRSLRYY